MYCQRVSFRIFLVIYILTGFILGIAALIIHNMKNGKTYLGSHISNVAQYYIGIVSLYILITGIIHLIIINCCKKLFLCLRLPVVLLIFGIIIELIVAIVIIIITLTTHSDAQKTTLIVMGSVAGYFIILQIYGIIASLSYHAKLQNNYEAMPSK